MLIERATVNWDKNRDRLDYSFANINLLGTCNAYCFFCLGKDIEKQLQGKNQLRTHFNKWENFELFLEKCRANKIEKLYITGQNTDSLLYKYLSELIDYLHKSGFGVGLRTNGYRAVVSMETINKCDLSVGYSVHTLNPITNKMILGRNDIPNWRFILENTKNARVQIVLNRCNQSEFYEILRFLSELSHSIKYVQVRRVSTDTRQELLTPDAAAYEQIYTEVAKIFPLKKKFFTDAEAYDIFGLEVVFWRTVKTSVNSMNYFTDGTVSDKYFIIEGYLESCEKEK